MPDTRTISMEGSKYSWADIDEHAKKKGYKERSKYIQTLAVADIERKTTFKDFITIEVIFLLLLAMIMLLLILVYSRVV